MYRPILLALSGISFLPALVAATTSSTTLAVCSADNCLRAIRASVYPTVHGTASCSSYFLTTLIPPTITVTATSSIPETASATLDVTLTETIYTTATAVLGLTATTTVDETATTTILVTATDILDVTATSVIDVVGTETDSTTFTTILDASVTTFLDVTVIHTDSVTETITSTQTATLVDRTVAATTTKIVPSSIPAFASPCSGSVRYSSACSCIGVTAMTTTFPAPVTTTTVPYTYTAATITTTITVSTDVAIVTDLTQTVLTTVSTETDFATVSTETDVVTDSTAVVTSTDYTEIDTSTTSTATLEIPVSTVTELTTVQTVIATTTDATIESTVTATVLVVPTVTVTATCANAEPTFALQVQGGAYNNEYLFGTPFVNQGADLASAETTITAASAYTLVGTTLYEYNGNILSVVTSTKSSLIGTYAEFRPASAVSSGADTPFNCKITANQLTCSLGVVSQAGICNISGAVLVLTEPGVTFSGVTCSNVVLNVIPLCIVP